MVRGLHEGVNGLLLGWTLDGRNREMVSRSAKVSARANDNSFFRSSRKSAF